MNINSRILICGWLFVMGSVSFWVYGKKDSTVKDPWVGWHRPVDANVFTSDAREIIMIPFYLWNRNWIILTT